MHFCLQALRNRKPAVHSTKRKRKCFSALKNSLDIRLMLQQHMNLECLVLLVHGGTSHFNIFGDEEVRITEIV